MADGTAVATPQPMQAKPRIAVVGDGQISDNPIPRKAMMPPCTTANRGPIRDTRASPVNRPISCAPCNPTKAMPATNGMTSNCRSR